MKLQNQLYKVLLISSLTLTVQAVEKASDARLDEIARRGKHVMPFSLDQTVHVFAKRENGGLQQVIVKNKSDLEQIKLIRKHLAEIAQNFQQSDFSDPTRLHGEDMPGLSALKKAKPDEFYIKYTELPDGAQITYATDKPELILAIHLWFNAQLNDHAHHAMPYHPHHLIYSK